MNPLAQKVVGWRTWYDDGKIYSSEEHFWSALPDDGVLVRIIYYDDGRKQIQHAQDFYFEAPHSEGTIYGTGSIFDDLEARYLGACVKRGRWAPDEFYMSILNDAMKSTWKRDP